MMTFDEFIEMQKTGQVDEGFFGMFASPLAKMIDAHPTFQALAKQVDKARLAKIKRALEADLGRSGNDVRTANGRVTLNGLIGQSLDRMVGNSGRATLDTTGAKVTNPMSYKQRQDFDGNYDRFN